MNSPSSLETGRQDREVSLYGEGNVSAETFTIGAARIKQAFPKLPIGWYKILETMIDEENFTDKRFADSVNNLIKTCPFPEPTIANILGYDKKVKIYTYNEVTAEKLWSDVEAIDAGLGKPRWIKKENFSERFKKWEKK